MRGSVSVCVCAWECACACVCVGVCRCSTDLQVLDSAGGRGVTSLSS